MPPPPVPSRALALHSSASSPSRPSSRQDVVDLTVSRSRIREPSAASRKRSYSTSSIETERISSPTFSAKRERGEKDEWSVTPRTTPIFPPPRAVSHARMPYRHASSVSTVGLLPPRPRVSRKSAPIASNSGEQPAPDDLRHAVSQVRAKLETFGQLSDSEAGLALATLLGRLYDRSHLADRLDLETEGWLESFRSAMLQVLSLSNLHLVTSWLTTKMGLKALVATKAPSTALLARLNDAWKGRALRRKLVDVLGQTPGSRRATLTEVGELVYEVEGLQRALVRDLWP